MKQGEKLEKLMQVVVNVAGAQVRDGSDDGLRCECYFTMGQVKHVCVFCQAREVLEEVDP